MVVVEVVTRLKRNELLGWKGKVIIMVFTVSAPVAATATITKV